MFAQWRASSSHDGVEKPGGGNIPLPARCISIYRRVCTYTRFSYAKRNARGTYFNVKTFMFNSHDKRACNVAC